MRTIVSALSLATLLLVGCGDDSTSGGGGSGGDGGTAGAGGDGGAGGAGGDGGAGAEGGAGGSGGGVGGEGGAGGAGTQDIEIEFTGKIDGADFVCGTTYENVGSGLASGELSDFRFYLHDVELLSGAEAVPVELIQDGVWQYENVVLLDFENKSGACANGTFETNFIVRGQIPGGFTADGIRFKLGVPFDLNHAASAIAPSPLNLSALFWSWQGGYKFLRADFVPSAAASSFNLHLGSTGCDGDPATGGTTMCSRENVTQITLNGFDPSTDVIAVDYGAVVAASNLGAPDAGGAPGCMSGMADPECGPIFANLGINIADGSLDPAQQTLFSVAD